MKKLETLEQIYDEISSYHQVTAQELLNGRTYLPETGWSDVELSFPMKVEIVNRIVEIAGGREKQKTSMRFRLMQERPQHWALDRFVVAKYSVVKLIYIAGQDQSYEMKQLRKYLSK